MAISSVFGWPPTQIRKLSFYERNIYSEFAFNKLISGNGFVSHLGSINKSVSGLPRIDDKIREKEIARVSKENEENVNSAKLSLIKKTGRKSFSLTEIKEEIRVLYSLGQLESQKRKGK